MTNHARRTASVAACLMALGTLLSAQGMSATDAYRVRNMLGEAYNVVKKNYYDAKFHGLDWDARYREYQEKLKSAPRRSTPASRSSPRSSTA